ALEGYLVASLVGLDVDIPADDATVQAFKDAGFPASYWPALRELKTKHPNWTFTPMMVNSNYSWDAIINAQNVPGRSLLPNSWSSAYKSYETASFDYKTDSWKPYDSGTWVMANKQTIGYYLDPRNWLYEDTVFMFENLKYNSALHTRAGVASILAGTFMDGTYIDNFIKAAVSSGVSPYHLAARSRIEVVVPGGGGSGSVTGTYVDPYKGLDLTGHYNFYNIGAFQGDHPIRNGLEYALYGPDRKPEQTATDNEYLIPWKLPDRAIVGGANFIGKSYINKNQQTIYLQKFDLDDQYDGVFWHQYMGNLYAPVHEGRTTYKAFMNMNQLNNSFEFIIPVIAGMPEAPVPEPTDARSRNPWIKTLDVSGLALNKPFDPAVTEYSMTLNHEITSTTITASPVNGKATITGTGTYSIMPGTNIITITGVAEAGETRAYTVSIIRKAADGSIPPDVYRPQNPTVPALSFSQQSIKVQSNVMTGLDPAQNLNTVEQFVSSLGVTAGYQVQVFKSDGTPQTEMMGTGNIVRINYE
ncbi:MAG: hypothetical protein GX028_08655, partial [Clostridiaceae bacterium]|nr:hypothetical protein [Clostridiaceae bacterium]